MSKAPMFDFTYQEVPYHVIAANKRHLILKTAPAGVCALPINGVLYEVVGAYMHLWADCCWHLGVEGSRVQPQGNMSVFRDAPRNLYGVKNTPLEPSELREQAFRRTLSPTQAAMDRLLVLLPEVALCFAETWPRALLDGEVWALGQKVDMLTNRQAQVKIEAEEIKQGLADLTAARNEVEELLKTGGPA